MKQTNAKGRQPGRKARKAPNNDAGSSKSDTGAGAPQTKGARTRKSSTATVRSASKTSRATRRAGGPQTKSAVLSPKAAITAIHRETGATLAVVTEVFRSLSRIAAEHLGPNGAGMFTIPEVGMRIWRIAKPGAKRQFAYLTGVPLKRLMEATGTGRMPLPAS